MRRYLSKGQIPLGFVLLKDGVDTPDEQILGGTMQKIAGGEMYPRLCKISQR